MTTIKAKVEQIVSQIVSEKPYNIESQVYEEHGTDRVVVQFRDRHVGPVQGEHTDAVEVTAKPDTFDEGVFTDSCHSSITIIDEDRADHHSHD